MPHPTVSDVATLAATGGPTPGSFDGRLAYVNSKLCNLWFTYELSRRAAAARLGVTANGYDPGLVPGSGLAREYPAALRAIWNGVLPGLARLLSPVLPTVNPAPKSGAALANLVFDPALEGVTGKYFPSHSRWREAPSSELSYDEKWARALWDESIRMAGLAAGESPIGG
jgi:NAD(P)-dependent dehydrogenase (short-subunit alcohol dehydrogenase family)